MGTRPESGVSPFQGTFWKTVSEDCNLACDYCYYSTCQGKPGTEIRRIEDKALINVISQVMNTTDGSAAFAWQGGEPLLAGLPFFEKVVSLQASLAKPNTVIGNAVQTNGTLIDSKWAAFFRRYSFLVGVSLDGPQPIHDKRRRTGSGAGTYALVMRGVEELRGAGVDFNVLTVLHEDNIEEADLLMEWMLENDFRHVQFIPGMDFRSQEAETESKYLITPLQYGEFLCRVFDLWHADGCRISIRLFDNWLQKLAGQEPELCVHRGSCSSTLVLEQNGDAYPCDFYIDPAYKLGNVNEQTFEELAAHPVRQQFASQKTDRLGSDCRSCRYLHYCQGGCPRSRRGCSDPNIQGQDYFCESYRMLYAYAEERMRKVAGRLTKQMKIKRPGRNDPCLCGSGLKAKKCCDA